MRISTTEMFRNGIQAIQQHQSVLARTQEQLATGRRFLSPADDPGAAVQALKLREGIDAVEQYARNAVVAQSRLTQEESVLDQMGRSLQRARELAVQSGSAALDGPSRAAIAREIRQIGDALIDLANTRDANGEYLFAGFRSQNEPFVRNAGGVVEYLGDQGVRRIDLSPDRAVSAGDSGISFMTIPRGNGTFVVLPAASNTGTAHVASAEVVDASAVDDASFVVAFTSATAYEVRDGGGALVSSGALAPGQAIDVGGRRISFEGAPAAGDVFDIDPAHETSMFAMVDSLAALLEAPGQDAAAGARRSDALSVSLQNLDQALGRVMEVRSDVGARLQTIDEYGLVNEDRTLGLTTALSAVEDLDYAEAISRFELQQVALQAAQQTYVQLNRLTLFDFVR